MWRSALRSDGSTGIGRVVPLPELSETQRSARLNLCDIQKRGLRSLRDERTAKFGPKQSFVVPRAFEHCRPIQPFVLAQGPVEIETDLDTE